MVYIFRTCLGDLWSIHISISFIGVMMINNNASCGSFVIFPSNHALQGCVVTDYDTIRFSLHIRILKWGKHFVLHDHLLRTAFQCLGKIRKYSFHMIRIKVWSKLDIVICYHSKYFLSRLLSFPHIRGSCRRVCHPMQSRDYR